MDDDLLRALGRHQREDLEVPPPASEPLREDEADALLDAVFARVDAGQADDAKEPTAPPVELAPVIDLAARRRQRTMGIVLALAAALVLGVGLVVLLGQGRNDAPQVASLPSYATSELRGGPALTRSDERPSELTMTASDQLDWIITPAQAPAHALELGLLIEPADAPADARWITKVPATITESGVIRIRAPLAELAELEPGAYAITLIIAAQGGLPSDREAARTREDVQRVAIRITVTAAG